MRNSQGDSEMTHQLIIGMSGKIASGKDSVGQSLIEKFSADYTQVSFGDELKEEVNLIVQNVLHHREYSFEQLKQDMGVDDNLNDACVEMLNALEMDKRINKLTNAWNKTPGVRVAAQVWGTDVRRAQNEDYWTNKAKKTVLSCKGTPVLISDMRFPNEMDLVKELGGYTIRLDVDPEVQRLRLFARDGHSIIPEHDSETSLDNREDFFARIDNSYNPLKDTVDILYSLVQEDLDEIR